MFSKQFKFMPGQKIECEELNAFEPDFMFLFAGIDFFENKKELQDFRDKWTDVQVIGCSTAGEISDDGVTENSMVLTAIRFEKEVGLKAVHASSLKEDGGLSGGRSIGKELASEDLKAIFVLGQGIDVNGSAMIEGIVGEVGDQVILTGGLAGDNGRFERTYTYLNGDSFSDEIVALGLYGDNIRVSYGSKGGWEPFGPAREVTKAEGNILLELDSQPALEIYEKYLGKKAAGLPASGLLYPLAILNENEDTTGIIRTILGIDREKGSLTLAGDIQNGGMVRLMHTETDGLVEGAQGAAELASEVYGKDSNNGLGLLISCVGRKLVMGEDTEEEVEVVKGIFGESTLVAGFYSYGEICPFKGLASTKLHNQTMTITRISEVG